jgi:hypothetical protein
MLKRVGLTYIEVAVALALVALVAALTYPQLSGYAAARRARDTAAQLLAIQLGLDNNNVPLGTLGYLNAVQESGKDPDSRYPARLSQLVIPVTTSDVDCSGTKYSATKVTGWQQHGPFTGLVVTARVGINTRLGVIRDSVFLGSGVTAGTIDLRIDSVHTRDAENIDLYVDRALDSLTGQIRYEASIGAPANTDLHVLKFVLPTWVGC